jgi:hypothetical protein
MCTTLSLVSNQEVLMPDRKTISRARRDKRAGKSASTQAGEFVRDEMRHIRAGKHGARSTKQAIAIGLSEARRSGVALPAPRKGRASKATRKRAQRDLTAGKRATKKRPAAKRKRAVRKALKRESTRAASRRALSRHARSSARRRTAAQRSASARKGARTKGAAGRSRAAKKAARTRARRARR